MYFKCNLCGAKNTEDKWNLHTREHFGNIIREIQNDPYRLSYHICPSCKCDDELGFKTQKFKCMRSSSSADKWDKATAEVWGEGCELITKENLVDYEFTCPVCMNMDIIPVEN